MLDLPERRGGTPLRVRSKPKFPRRMAGMRVFVDEAVRVVEGGDEDKDGSQSDAPCRPALAGERLLGLDHDGLVEFEELIMGEVLVVVVGHGVRMCVFPQAASNSWRQTPLGTRIGWHSALARVCTR